MIKNLGDVFIDTSTGEIVDSTPYCVSSDLDINQVVTEALTGVPEKILTTTALIKQGKGRRPKVIYNPYASIFQNLPRRDYVNAEGVTKSVPVMNGTLGDIVDGALRLNEGTDNTVIPVGQIVFVLSHMESLSVDNIKELFTARRALKGDNIPNKRYCQYLLRKCESVISSVSYHFERGSLDMKAEFSIEQDAKDHANYGKEPSRILSPIAFTETDRKIIRGYVLKGLHEQATAYIKGITETYQRYVARVEKATSVKREIVYAEDFKNDPYVTEQPYYI